MTTRFRTALAMAAAVAGLITTCSRLAAAGTVTITIPAATVGSTLTDFPVMVRLSDLPASFWASVEPDGSDIQVQTAGGTRIPHDLVRLDTSAHDGVLWFKAPSVSAASDTVFRIVYGGAAAPFTPTVTALTITNPGADVDVSSWTNDLGSVGRRTTNPAPHSGAGYFFGNTNAETRAHQDVAVPVGEQSGVDAGALVARVRWYQAGFGIGDLDRGEVELQFFDGSMASLGSRRGAGAVVSGNFADFVDQVWRARELQLPVPANTRTIRVSLHMIRKSGTNNDAYIDDVDLALVSADPYGPEHVWSDYSGVWTLGDDPHNRVGGAAAEVNYDPNLFEVTATSPQLTAFQGVAWDGTYYYVSGTDRLQKYDNSWTLVAQNTNIFSNSGITGASHMGDLDVHDGVIYAGMVGNGPTSAWVTAWDASDLSFQSKFEITAQLVDSAAAVAYKASSGTIFVASFNDGSGLWEYQTDGTFVGKLTFSKGLGGIQGLTYWRHAWWVASDDVDETYKVEDDGWVLDSGLYGESPITEWEGVGSTTDGLLQLARYDGVSDYRVKTWKPIDFASGGGVDFTGTFNGGSTTLENLFAGGVGSVQTFTVGVSFAVGDKSANQDAVGYYRAAAGNTDTRVTVAYHSATSRLSVWDTANSWLDASIDPTLNQSYRVHAIYDGTTTRRIYVDGSLEATDPGSITAAPSTLDTILLGRDDESGGGGFIGQIGFVYLTPRVLSADWIAAETLNLNDPGSFYTVSADVVSSGSIHPLFISP